MSRGLRGRRRTAASNRRGRTRATGRPGVAQRLRVAGGLRVDQRRGSRTGGPGIGRSAGSSASTCRKTPGRRAALVQLARRVQVARAEAHRASRRRSASRMRRRTSCRRASVAVVGVTKAWMATYERPALGRRAAPRRRRRLGDRRQLAVLLVGRRAGRARSTFAACDVRLVEGVDAEHARRSRRWRAPTSASARRGPRGRATSSATTWMAGGREGASIAASCVASSAHVGEDAGRRRRRRARRARSSASGTTPVPSLPVDSAISCSSQRPKRPERRRGEDRQLVAALARERRPAARRAGAARCRPAGTSGAERVARPQRRLEQRRRSATPASAAGHQAEQRQRRVAAADVGAVR